MIILTHTNLTVTLDGASSAPLPVVVTYVDVSEAQYRPSNTTTTTNGVTAVTIAAAPPTALTRQVKLITITNVAVANVGVNILHGTTLLCHVTLAPNYALQYADGRGFYVINSVGAVLTTRSTVGSGGASTHNLLDGLVISDSVARTVTRGALVVGNSTPQWDRLSLGAAGRFVRSDGTDASWARINGSTDLDGPLVSTVPANQLGAAGGSLASPTNVNTNILLYNSSGTNWAGIGVDTGGSVYFVGGAGAGSAATRMYINTSNGRVNVSESFEVSKGVQFPAVFADQASPNCLDDYEEGTFTPVLGGSTSESGQSYSTQTGNYVKVGSMVHCGIYMQFSNKGTITGNLYVKNLPFAGGGGSATHAASVGYMTNLSNAGTPNPRRCVMGYLLGASTSITLFSVDDFNSVNPVQMTGTDVNNTTQLIISITYRTNY